MSLRIAFSCIALGRLWRGGELIVGQLADHLARAGHDVTVYQSGPARPGVAYETRVLPLPYEFYDLTAPPLAPSLGALVGRLRRLRALGCIAAFTAAVHADVLRRRPDVFCIQHGWPESYLQPLCQRLGVKTVALGNGPLRSDALMAGSSLDAFIATNPVQAAWARYFLRAPVTLMRMGVDLARFQPHGPASPVVLGLPAPRVLLCGGLVPIKRVPLAIGALAQLARGSLVLVGDGPERAALQRQLSEKLPGRSLMLGAVPHEDLAPIYRAADVLAFPSGPAETAGQVILEALACGTPVVASDDLIRRWLVGDGGLTCEVSDARRFAAALQAAQAEGPALRARARAQAERCGWKGVAAGFAALADDLRAGRAVAASYGLSGDEAPFLSLDRGFQAPAREPREPGMEARA